MVDPHSYENGLDKVKGHSKSLIRTAPLNVPGGICASGNRPHSAWPCLVTTKGTKIWEREGTGHSLPQQNQAKQEKTFTIVSGKRMALGWSFKLENIFFG